MRSGEVKIPGGKLVRVTLQGDEVRGWHATIDGDFFMEANAGSVLGRAQSAIDAHLPELPDDWEHWGSADYLAFYRALSGELRGVIGDTLIGANGEAIALAVVRALVGGGARESAQTAEREFERIREARATRQGERAQSGDEPAPMLIGLQDAKRRWARMNPQTVVDIPRMPAEQMQVDELWATQVANGERQATLRIWDWAAPAVVCGKFQSIADEVDLEYAKEHGIEVVRRDTGGGAMFIEPGNTITYSLYAPLDFVHGISIEESYRLCDWWLVEALRGLGLDVRFAGLNDIASQYGKIGGAAQRRFPGTGNAGESGAVLHHVTMAYDIDAAKMARVLNTSQEKLSDKAVRSAVKRVDPMKSQTGLTREQIIDDLLAWFTPAQFRGDAS